MKNINSNLLWPVFLSAIFFPAGLVWCLVRKILNVVEGSVFLVSTIVLLTLMMMQELNVFETMVIFNGISAAYLAGYLAPVKNKEKLMVRLALILTRIIILLSLLAPASMLPMYLVVGDYEISNGLALINGQVIYPSVSEISIFIAVSIVALSVIAYGFTAQTIKENKQNYT